MNPKEDQDLDQPKGQFTQSAVLLPKMVAERFQLPSYHLHRRVLRIFGGAFYIRDDSNALVFYSNKKSFKVKTDIRLYTDDSMSQEVLTILARQTIDFASAYDVIDTVTKAKVGVLKRKGFRSMIQDEWIIMDANDQEIGKIVEDNALLALSRRFLVNLIPQTYYVEIGGQRVATFKGNLNPFVYNLSINFFDEGRLDRRIGLAAAVLFRH